MTQSLIRVIVQIDVRDFDRLRIKLLRIHSETMILRSNLNFPRPEILHRMVRTPVSELQLVGLPTKSKSHELMAQANSENWPFPHQLPDVLNPVANRRRIARAVREKNAVRSHLKHFLGRK